MVPANAIGSADSHAISYRPDIDGLRAVAVLSVIVYHLSKTALAGGYLGVDMFFVLSGFLITTIIWREAQLRDFSILRFYNRRIRRILPALLVLLFFTTIAATILLLPADLIGYNRSLIATMAFVANFYFWRDTDYFARVAEFKPLLHMWSLGVEEQFYIFFPLLLVLLARFRLYLALSVIGVLTIASFVLNIFAIHVGGFSPAFFLLPTRAWELGLGAIIALLPAHVMRPSLANIIALLALALITLGIVYPFTVTPSTPVATPVVLGTALLILTGKHGRPMVNRMFSVRPIVFVGLISYSLYLWHWPVFVFFRYYFVNGLSTAMISLELVIVVLAAMASWRYVERPFRSKRIANQTVIAASGASVAILAAIGALILFFHGLPNRLDAQAATINQSVGTHYRCPVSEYLTLGLNRACPMSLPSRDPADADVVLLGNSHAQMYAPEWTAIFADLGVHGLLVPFNTCLPTIQANFNQECNDVAEQNLTSVLNLPRVHTVILAFTWWHDTLVDRSGHVFDNRDTNALVSALDDLISRVRQAGKQIILIGPIAEPGWDVATTISRELAFGWPEKHQNFLPQTVLMQRFGAAIQHFQSEPDITFVPAFMAQCQDDRCYYVMNGHALYSDESHIAVAELWRFHAMFVAAFANRH
jgi:peptidoglycan/LPS O-acetylase OafA/YrhL